MPKIKRTEVNVFMEEAFRKFNNTKNEIIALADKKFGDEYIGDAFCDLMSRYSSWDTYFDKEMEAALEKYVIEEDTEDEYDGRGMLKEKYELVKTKSDLQNFLEYIYVSDEDFLSRIRSDCSNYGDDFGDVEETSYNFDNADFEDAIITLKVMDFLKKGWETANEEGLEMWIRNEDYGVYVLYNPRTKNMIEYISDDF